MLDAWINFLDGGREKNVNDMITLYSLIINRIITLFNFFFNDVIIYNVHVIFLCLDIVVIYS